LLRSFFYWFDADVDADGMQMESSRK